MSRLLDHLILCLGCLFMAGPVVYLLLGVIEHPAIWAALWDLFHQDLLGGSNVGVSQMLLNALILAGAVAVLGCSLSLLASFALVFFAVPGREWIFGAMLLAMFFPIETRILPSFAVVHELGLLNTRAGMILPIVASGFGVLVFRQFLKQVPKELIEAARLDGARPLRCLWDILLPMALPMVAALFAIFFVLGWNQYVWPLMLTTTREDLMTIVGGVARARVASVEGQFLALIALLPPGLVMILTQRWLMRGLTSGIH